MDLNGDGLRDVITGSWPGELYLFAGLKDGSFAKSEQITHSGKKKPLKADNASAIFACDWDRDGDLDLLVGDIVGNITLFRRDGKQFAKGERLEADGKKIKVKGGDAAPCVADWDGDGNPDLLTGTDDGSVLLYRNLTAKGEPSLAAPKTLIEGSSSWEKPSKDGHGRRAKICVTDWNEDGKLDLLVGDFASGKSKKTGSRQWHGWVWLYLRRAEVRSF